MNQTIPSYYRHHIFFCLNQREGGQACCASHGAQAAFEHCKARVKALGLTGPGGVRVNKAGCLDRCAGAPVAVVYPEAVWYTYTCTDDIDEIITAHLQGGQGFCWRRNGLRSKAARITHGNFCWRTRLRAYHHGRL